eukprot:gnl/Trimastix_PCT/2635.p1 GENE.gnl/Trimastix_PCT/2635~~gnl/Trimastix_PCT/2635.p1  ORF type:complete len:443 (+),score=50.31 gnl/Trimastix_PCT/2635:53-1381(+)
MISREANDNVARLVSLEFNRLLEKQKKRGKGEKKPYLTLDQVLEFKLLPDTFNHLTFDHVSVLFLLDSDHDGRFILDNFVAFADLCYSVQKVYNPNDFILQLRGYCVHALWRFLSHVGGVEEFERWIVELLSKNHRLRRFQSAPGTLFVSSHSARIFHRILDMWQTGGNDFQSFYYASQRLGEKANQQPLDNERLDDFISVSAVRAWARHYLLGFMEMMRRLDIPATMPLIPPLAPALDPHKCCRHCSKAVVEGHNASTSSHSSVECDTASPPKTRGRSPPRYTQTGRRRRATISGPSAPRLQDLSMPHPTRESRSPPPRMVIPKRVPLAALNAYHKTRPSLPAGTLAPRPQSPLHSSAAPLSFSYTGPRSPDLRAFRSLTPPPRGSPLRQSLQPLRTLVPGSASRSTSPPARRAPLKRSQSMVHNPVRVRIRPGSLPAAPP